MLRSFTAAALSATLAAAAAAQVSPASLTSKMEDIAAYPLWPVSMSSQTFAKSGYGFEASFVLGEWRVRQLKPGERADRCDVINRAKPGTCNPAATSEVDTTIVQFVAKSGGGIDTVYTISRDPLTTATVQIEVAIGNKITELGKDGIVSGWNLSGRVVEWPTFTFYGVFNPVAFGFAPYVGATMSQGTLKGVRIAQGDSVATIESESLGGGISFGLVGGGEKVRVYGEMEYTRLSFNTANWKRPGNLPAAGLPDRLHLTGWRAMIGIQFGVGDEK